MVPFKKELNKYRNRVGCLILIFIGGYLLFFHLPGFLAYREKRHLEEAENWCQVIQRALAAFKENQKDHNYPLNVPDWQTLRKIAGSQGANLPYSASAAKINAFRYESANGSDYRLTIVVDLSEKEFK
jgi:hypothetical protein